MKFFSRNIFFLRLVCKILQSCQIGPKLYIIWFFVMSIGDAGVLDNAVTLQCHGITSCHHDVMLRWDISRKCFLGYDNMMSRCNNIIMSPSLPDCPWKHLIYYWQYALTLHYKVQMSSLISHN